MKLGQRGHLDLHGETSKKGRWYRDCHSITHAAPPFARPPVHVHVLSSDPGLDMMCYT